MTYRARAFPFWLCAGIGVPLLLLATTIAVSNLTASPRRNPFLIVGVALTLGVPAALALKLGIDIRRMTIVIEDDGVELALNEFRIWSLRPFRRARLAWADVWGVTPYEVPNPIRRGGLQVDFVLHTRVGRFAISTAQFHDAEAIATALASRSGRRLGELDQRATPVRAASRADRIGVHAMRALGWVSLLVGAGVFVLAVLSLVVGRRADPYFAATLVGLGAILLWLGRFARRFTLR